LLNYVNYFTEIENHFQCKRDVFTLLTTLDWVLIENWKEQGIPLETVLKGIDRAFERPNARRRIGSLAYCVKAVAQVCEEQKDMKVAKPELPEVSGDEVATYIEKMATAVSSLCAKFPEFASRLDTLTGAIRQLDVSNLRLAEQTLSAMEEKLIALLKVACDEAILLELKREVDGDLNPFRSTMTTEQLTMLDQQMWRRKLMERFEVPRLSLFYLI
jgi:hypothetical protein